MLTANLVSTDNTRHSGAIASIVVSQDGKMATGGWDHYVVSSKLSDDRKTHSGRHKAWVNALNFSADDTTLVSCSYDQTICLWNTTTGELTAKLTGKTGAILAVAFAPNTSRIICGTRYLQVWDITSGTLITELNGHMSWVTSVNFSRDGQRFVSGSDDCSARVWDFQTGNCLCILNGHTKGVTSVQFSNDGAYIVTGSQDMTVRIWDSQTGVQRHVLPHNSEVNSVLFLFDDTCIASAGDDGVRCWGAEDGECLLTLPGEDVLSLAWHAQTQYLMAGDCDATLRIWKLNRGVVS